MHFKIEVIRNFLKKLPFTIEIQSIKDDFLFSAPFINLQYNKSSFNIPSFLKDIYHLFPVIETKETSYVLGHGYTDVKIKRTLYRIFSNKKGEDLSLCGFLNFGDSKYLHVYSNSMTSYSLRSFINSHMSNHEDFQKKLGDNFDKIFSYRYTSVLSDPLPFWEEK